MIITIKCGEVEGLELDSSISYRGIRYATADRFEYPKLVEKWEGIYDATKYGKCSFQQRAFYDEKNNPDKFFYYKEFRENLDFEYSDDCLFLNIWTPRNITSDSKLPVIFYIHGGSFTGGCGAEKHFDGPKWCEKNVIAVTFNYRLGPWGFMCLSELEQEAGHTGNYGMCDQIAALTWIKQNIEAFGGDNKNITIMGQSAGAMSVQQLVFSPLAKGLFSKVVMSSGAGVNSILNVKRKASDYYDFWNQVMIESKCNTIEELRQIEPKILFDAFEKIKNNSKIKLVCFPCIDGIFLTKKSLEYYKALEYSKVPYLVGTNINDLLSPLFHMIVMKWCKMINQDDCYCYLFGRNLPGDKKGAFHSSDLWYWFGTLNNCWRPFEETDTIISETMVSYLTNFAKNGNPNDDQMVFWEPTNIKNRKVLYISDNTITMKSIKVRSLIKYLKFGKGE